MPLEKQKMLIKESVYSTNTDRLRLLDIAIETILKERLDISLDRFELYLILDEAITNAMDHGNRWDKSKKVILKIEKVEKESVKIYIKDEGIGFNPKILPDVLNNNGKLNPRGRGIYIIRKFCPIEWNVVGNEVCITLETKN
ncbi:MAG: ATP-binding protein [Spirochaetia bacterium]|nr:ATP-binding protein [Spirochaetia bacterium]